ncbi:MAG: hypothetical protein M3Y77_17865 [Actinomycetota bacterium]|nr:hypothetical protein [Actinomycetota bacterium]
MNVDPERLKQMAMAIAIEHGDPAPTGIYWTESTRVDAAKLIGWGLGENEDGTKPQIVLLLTGTFVSPIARGPWGSTVVPSGSAITLVMTTDYAVTDFGICPSMSSEQLAGIGVVQALTN